MNKIITIGRELGSGGRELGQRLAEELNIAYYDREILTEIAKRTSFTEDYVKQVVEHAQSASFVVSVGHNLYPGSGVPMDQTQAIYQEQASIIRELAEKSPCVLVGRCADYILRESNPLRIFVCADMEKRMERCRTYTLEKEISTDKELKQFIRSVDKQRSRYYEFYTGQTWGDPLNYDLTVNTTTAEISEIAPIIAKLFK